MTYLRRPPRIIRLTEGVAAAPLSVVIDQLTEGRKAIWHWRRQAAATSRSSATATFNVSLTKARCAFRSQSRRRTRMPRTAAASRRRTTRCREPRCRPWFFAKREL